MNRQICLYRQNTPPRRYRTGVEISLILAGLILMFLSVTVAFPGIPVRTAAASEDAGFSSKIICTEEDFKENASALLGGYTIFSDAAWKLHQTDLVVGETYYLVIGVKLEISDAVNFGSQIYDPFDFYAFGALRFSIKRPLGMFSEDRSVTYSLDSESLVTPDGQTEVLDACIKELPDVNLIFTQNNVLGTGMHTYVAIPFVPLQEGVLTIECAMLHHLQEEVVNPKRYEDENPYLTATVTNSPKYLTEYGAAEISGLDFGIVEEQQFDSEGEISLDSYGNSKTYASSRRNYMIVEFDISRGTAQQTGCGAVLFADPSNKQKSAESELYFTIFFAESSCLEDVEVEMANTGTMDIRETQDGTFISFCYSLPEDGIKNARIVISFMGGDSASSDSSGEFPVEMYMFSKTTVLTGTTGLKETVQPDRLE